MNLDLIIKNIILKKITLCNARENFELLKIRNEKNIRIKMFGTKIITKLEHQNWLKQIKSKKLITQYCIIYKKTIIGGLILKKNYLYDNCIEWAFYLTEKSSPTGLGACVEYVSIKYIFNNYAINYIYCYVLKANQSIYKLHKKFGFKESFELYNKMNSILKKKFKVKSIALKLSRLTWVKNKKYFLTLFKIK